MPIGVGIAIAAAISAAGQVAGAKMAGNASRRATDAQSRATKDAADYQAERDRKADEDFQNAEKERKASWDAEQARLAPYRQRQEEAARIYANEIGVPYTPPPTPTMPPDWGKPPSTTAPPTGTGTRPPVSGPYNTTPGATTTPAAGQRTPVSMAQATIPGSAPTSQPGARILPAATTPNPNQPPASYADRGGYVNPTQPNQYDPQISLSDAALATRRAPRMRQRPQVEY